MQPCSVAGGPSLQAGLPVSSYISRYPMREKQARHSATARQCHSHQRAQPANCFFHIRHPEVQAVEAVPPCFEEDVPPCLFAEVQAVEPVQAVQRCFEEEVQQGLHA